VTDRGSRDTVHIVAQFSVEGVRFIVADEGAGFERDKIPDPTEPFRLLEPTGADFCSSTTLWMKSVSISAATV
jgi:hypothetical protein